MINKYLYKYAKYIHHSSVTVMAEQNYLGKKNLECKSILYSTGPNTCG